MILSPFLVHRFNGVLYGREAGPSHLVRVNVIYVSWQCRMTSELKDEPEETAQP